MAPKKKASAKSKSGKEAPGALLSQAVNAGRTAIKEASKRLPSDWREQVEKTVASATKRAVQKADLERLVSRLDKLADQVEALSRRVDGKTAAPPRTRSARTSRETAAKPAPKPATPLAKPGVTKPVPASTSAPRKRPTATTPRRRPAAKATTPPAAPPTP
ncbi:MAG TPA: hypothetical protein VG015_02235 [Candidatus Dormibacteraeota bacterium]|jgi:hypothetical protein|nr:hypothetical protein [Candidatus Dormibacteraeota bacterium]